MAFFRFSRDKRGYEHFYLVEPVTSRKGKSRQRVLYWYRTPPNVRVGRAPFDDEVRRALEAQYPGVTFDWAKIVDAPIPSAEADQWRERRRTERAERAARRATPTVENGDDAIVETEVPGSDAGETDSDAGDAGGEFADSAEPRDETAPRDATAGATTRPTEETPGEGSARRRRRRRRGRPEAGAREPSTTAAADAADAPSIDAEPGNAAPPDDSIEPSEE